MKNERVLLVVRLTLGLMLLQDAMVLIMIMMMILVYSPKKTISLQQLVMK